MTGTDIAKLAELNKRFISAFQRGSWDALSPILSDGFRYLDGASGEVWDMPRYIAVLDGNPSPSLRADEIRISVSGDVGIVSARTTRDGVTFGRYIDTYVREESGWRCVHACVWPLAAR